MVRHESCFRVFLAGGFFLGSWWIAAQEVGIGTTAPVARLDIQAPATYTSDLFRVYHGSNSYLIVKNNGNVGVNTISPQYTLEVNGNTLQSNATAWMASRGPLFIGNGIGGGGKGPGGEFYGPAELNLSVNSGRKINLLDGYNKWIYADFNELQITNIEAGAWNTITTIRIDSGYSARFRVTTQGMRELFVVKGNNGKVGIGTSMPVARLHLAQDGMIYARGTYNNGDTVPDGPKTAFIWNPRKAAVRIGFVNGSQWDWDSIGDFSVAMGMNNIALASSSTVSGGRFNGAREYGGTVGGGVGNVAAEQMSTVAGGNGDTALGYASTVGGGSGNVAAGLWSTVSGGQYNRGGGVYTAVSGGYANVAGGQYAAIGGGKSNRVDGVAGTIAGGDQNAANGNYSTVSGGRYDTASGTYSVVGGGYYNKATGWGSAVAGGYLNMASGSYSTIGGGREDTASGMYSTVGGGYSNKAVEWASTVGGGYTNRASGLYSTVAGGRDNTASGTYSTVGGGYSNKAEGWASTVGGGYTNRASGWYSTVAGGRGDTAAGTYSAVLGGADNYAEGFASAIVGGSDNRTAGSFSLAGGRGLQAASYGEVVVGLFNSLYTPNSTTGWSANDRLFVVGNGSSSTTRSDALVVLKNGNTGIGVSTPASDLHVAGTQVFSTNGGPVSGYAGLYQSGGELYAFDASGNTTVISPHNEQGEWHFNSRNIYTGRHLIIDVERLLMALDRALGGGYVRINGVVVHQGENQLERINRLVEENRRLAQEVAALRAEIQRMKQMMAKSQQ